MANRAATEWRYEKLTWPEINDAVELGKVCVLPCSAVEQHGPHLPLDVDVLCPTEIAQGAGRTIPDKMLVLPTHCYGYTGHVMDFPGTINTHFEHFMDSVLDITKSLAYHGFKKIILLNGHGSNWPNLDLVARRTNLETDAECVPICWWGLLTVDKEFMPKWRQSKFPGGCSHACELETSLYLYLDGDNVRKDQIKSGTISFNEEDSPFMWVDLFGAGPATPISWTSSYSDTGVLGDAELATAEKGRQAYEEVGQATRALRHLVQGPAQGHAQGPAPHAADHADPVGPAADRVTRGDDRGRKRASGGSPLSSVPGRHNRVPEEPMQEVLASLGLRLVRVLLDLAARAHAVRTVAEDEVVPQPLSVQQRARFPHHAAGLRLVGE